MYPVHVAPKNSPYHLASHPLLSLHTAHTKAPAARAKDIQTFQKPWAIHRNCPIAAIAAAISVADLV
jgi:hypothetical protein